MTGLLQSHHEGLLKEKKLLRQNQQRNYAGLCIFALSVYIYVDIIAFRYICVFDHHFLFPSSHKNSNKSIFFCRVETETGPAEDGTCTDTAPQDDSALDEITLARAKIEELSWLLEQSTSECQSLRQQLQLERFGVTRFSTDNTLINFYTGFPTYKSFVAFYKCIEPTACNMQSAYYKAGDMISLAGRKRCIPLIDEFFMFLCRLRAGLLEQDLSVRFNCSLSTVSGKIGTWANFLYFALGSIPIWLSKSTIQELMPDCFKQPYPNTRDIIDCTEIKTQQPSSLLLNSQLYSNKASQAIQSPRTVPFFLLVSLLDGYSFPNVLVKGIVAFEH